jgi:NAD(P)-dependent dehydrogenase (short-subunit alcohol dehydrogenase family)
MTSVQGGTPLAWVAGVGASAGLGAAVARRFARQGFTIAVTGRTVERLETVVREIQAAGGKAHAFAGDVTREEDVISIADRLPSLGSLETAVFNVSGGLRAPSLDVTSAAFEEALKTSAVGGFVFGREAVRRLLPKGRGTLLLTGATASLRGRPPFVAFAAAKAALRSVGQTFAREFGPRGIHVVHVVIDGGIDGERLRTRLGADRDPTALLALDDIAEVYWQLHAQPKSAWTQELDLRPFKEPF